MKSINYNSQKNSFLLISKFSILSFILFFVLISCSRNEEPTFTPTNIPFTTLGKSYIITNSSINIPQQNIVITNQAQWTNLLNQMNPHIWQPLTTTNVDFTTDIVIAVLDNNERPHTGFSITIISIIENEIHVVVDFSTMGSQNGYAVFTQPYHIVKIPRQSKPFIFQ
jgi:hypothetical protein